MVEPKPLMTFEVIPKLSELKPVLIFLEEKLLSETKNFGIVEIKVLKGDDNQILDERSCVLHVLKKLQDNFSKILLDKKIILEIKQ